MKIGIIGSSGGSVAYELIKAIDSKKHRFFIVTDRKCGLEDVALKNSVKMMRIEDEDNNLFSQKAKEFFYQQGGVDCIILFFLRLVTEELFEFFPTFNIHPSLLPAYKGFKALERAFEDNVNEIGATLHLVDKKVDHGHIIAQYKSVISPKIGLAQIQRISFAQKTYLALFLIDFYESNVIAFNNGIISGSGIEMSSILINPEMKNQYLHDAYQRFAIREGLEEIA